MFIKDEFKYNLSLSTLPVKKFPFQPSLTNSWFCPSPNIAREKGNNYEHICRLKNLLIVTKKGTLSKTIQDTELGNFVSEDAEHTVLFHGTDHLSAKNISVERGIYLFAWKTEARLQQRNGILFNKKCR